MIIEEGSGDGFVVFAAGVQLAMTIIAVMLFVLCMKKADSLHLVLCGFVGAQQC